MSHFTDPVITAFRTTTYRLASWVNSRCFTAGFRLNEQLHGELLPFTRLARLVLAHRPSGSRLELLLSDDCLSASAATTYKSYYPERPSLCLTGNNMTTLRMIASRCASAAAGSFNGRSSGRNRKISKRTRQVIENARGRLISLGSSCGKAPVLSPLFGLGPP